MTKPTDEPRLEDLFEKLFPCPEGVTLPVLRLGSAVPPDAQKLPPPGPRFDSSDRRYPLSLRWCDDTLGVQVFVLEEKDGLESIDIWAYAEGTRPGLRGKAVSVALLAEKSDRFKRLTVPLDKPEGEDGCSGKARFGSAVELREQLGEAVTVDVFLLE